MAEDPLVELYRAAKKNDPHDIRMALKACDADTTHVVRISEDGWVMRHPVACRISGDLFDCEYNDAIDAARWAGKLEGLEDGDYGFVKDGVEFQLQPRT